MIRPRGSLANGSEATSGVGRVPTALMIVRVGIVSRLESVTSLAEQPVTNVFVRTSTPSSCWRSTAFCTNRGWAPGPAPSRP